MHDEIGTVNYLRTLLDERNTEIRRLKGLCLSAANTLEKTKVYMPTAYPSVEEIETQLTIERLRSL